MGQTISYTTTEHDLDLGEKGLIRGLQYDQKARRYAGVPYALPPTGPRRWRKPEPLPASHVYRSEDGTGPYDATKFRDVCPQKVYHAVKSEKDPNTYSEDCLYVNIWTPVAAAPTGDEKKWPVKLWLHGGWFQMGDPSHGADMDPTELISTGGLDAVVVAIGYRLNVFGFLGGSALLAESGGASAGNFGLWDQRLAMEWVKANIGLFGGDPDNITLAGRSAGAYSVEAQMLYDFRRGEGGGAAAVSSSSAPEDLLFHRVFMCSNAIPAQPKSITDVDGQFDEVCGYFKIDADLPGPARLDRLREVPTADLVAALEHLANHTFRPITDGLFVHPGMYDYLQGAAFAGEFQRRGCRLLIGEVANEETLYSSYNSPQEPTLDALRRQVGNYYAPELTDRVLAECELPASEDLDEWKKCFGNIISDGQVRAPSRVLVRALVANGVPIESIWRYQIRYRLSFITEKVAPISFGVAHAMDRPIWK